MIPSSVVLLGIALTIVHGVLARDCNDQELKYMLTDCSADFVRWSVAVPSVPGACVVNRDPVKGLNCDESCSPGSYLDVKTGTCAACAAGWYSFGGQVLYNRWWGALPAGFNTWGSSVSGQLSDSCSSAVWTTQGGFLESSSSGCVSTLTYIANLHREGSISFEYQMFDTRVQLEVNVRNDWCSDDKSRHAQFPGFSSIYVNFTIPLQRGRNVIVWDAANYGAAEPQTQYAVGERTSRDLEEESTVSSEPTSLSGVKYGFVRIRSIYVDGLAYSTECSPCPAGTYSGTGSSSCLPCDVNYYSLTGSSTCTPCPEGTFSVRESSMCWKQPPCSSQHYYEEWSDCINGKADKTFHWIQPIQCSVLLPDAVDLPKPQLGISCPACNTGMYLNNSSNTCQFCPDGYIPANGSSCLQCPAASYPAAGLFITWWNSLPLGVLLLSCESRSRRGCTSTEGWQKQSTFISSGLGHTDDSVLIMNIHMGRFDLVHYDRPVVELELEMICEGQCNFQILEFPSTRQVRFLAGFKGKKDRFKHSFGLSSYHETDLLFVFTKVKDINAPTVIDHYNYAKDEVRLYSLNITGVLGFGAEKCVDCPKGSDQSGCISCQPGSYLDESTKRCELCPPNTYVNTSFPFGIKACIPCGPGTESPAGSAVCNFNKTLDLSGHSFNLTPICSPIQLVTPKFFLYYGTPYYHMYNISLCSTNQEVVPNCGTSTNMDEQSRSRICFTHVRESKSGHRLVSGDTVNLAQRAEQVRLVNINPVNISEAEIQAPRIEFLFRSTVETTQCLEGYRTHFELVCSTDSTVDTLPEPQCTNGRCDSCGFQFKWKTKAACPLCKESDYVVMKNPCENNTVLVKYIWKFPKYCVDGITLPADFKRECTILERPIGTALQEYRIFVILATLAAIGLFVLIFILCHRNRKLQYRYQKLVANANGMEGEFPEVDTCIADDDEDDSHQVEVIPKAGGPHTVFKKIKNMGNKNNRVLSDEGDFENVKLTDNTD